MIAGIRTRIEQTPGDSLALLLTLGWIVVFYRPDYDLQASALLTVAALTPLVLRSLLANAWIWAALLILYAANFLWFYAVADNHHWLALYWILACWLSTFCPTVSLADTARWLIGLSFGCATFWKLYGGQFVDGSFLEDALMSQPRFQDLLRLLTGMSFSDAKLATFTRDKFFVGFDGVTMAADQTPVPAALHAFSVVVSRATVGLEGMVALTFLLASRVAWFRRHRDWLLLAFLVGVYPFFNVLAFGMLLAVLGFVQAEPARRPLYLVVPVYLALVSLPWQYLLLS